LTTHWKEFRSNKDASSFIQEFKTIYQRENKDGVIISLPSDKHLLIQEIKKLKKLHISTILLGCEKKFCENSRKERDSPDKIIFNADGYNRKNKVFFSTYYDQIKNIFINVFHDDGTRRDDDEILEEIFRLITINTMNTLTL